MTVDHAISFTGKFKKFFLLCFCSLSLPLARSSAQVSVTATAGTPGPTAYTTLKGAFDAVNAGTHQGAVTIAITASTTETATAVLNASGSGSAVYTSVLVKPGTAAAPTVSGAIASAPIIKLNGASNVTINGSNNGTASRDLTITNTSATTPSVIWIGSVGTTPVAGDTLKNSVIVNGANTGNAVTASDAGTLGTAGYFNNITVRNNSIQKALNGVYLISTVAAGNGAATIVSGNDLNSSGTNAIRNCGVYLQGVSGATVSANNIGGFEAATAETDKGIWVATGATNVTVSGNNISTIAFSGTGAFAPVGINIVPAVTAANILVSGNVVSGLTSSGTGTTTGINMVGASAGVTIDRNKVSNIKNTNTSGFGAAGIFLSSTLTTAATTVSNNFVFDVAGYGGGNTFNAVDNGNGLVIDGGGGYDVYFNTLVLNTSQTATGGTRSAAMFVSANVTAANCINLRNNIFANFQTVGNGNSRFAFCTTAANTVFATKNYNCYWATSNNLTCQGTNPSITSTLAQIQTNLGGNTNSVVVQPVFTSATDYHLPYASNVGLNNLGLTIAGFATDFDNDTRSGTPDMGADEIENCATVTFNTQPVATPVCSGSNITLTIAATNGNVFQWQENTGSGFVNITNGGVYSGATSASLTLTNVPAGMNGYIYKCLVSPASSCTGVASNTATIAVNAAPSSVISPAGPVTVCGGSVALSVPSAANVNYQWKIGGSDISGATNNTYSAVATGAYTVAVNNTVNLCSGISAAAVSVTINTPPTATATPVGSTTVCSPATVVLNANTGTGLTYQWLLGGSPITGATLSSYTATATGNYSVTVTNAGPCSVTSPIVAVTVGTVSATIIPAGSTTFCSGGNVVLNANTGTNLTYQWQLNAGNITGATLSSYTATATGNYTVVVTNSVTTCSATSAQQVVTVGPPPPATTTPSGSVSICQGASTAISTNSAAGLTYQWYLNGNPITGATNVGYSANATGAYTVSVSSGPGCTSTSAALNLTVNPLPSAVITPASSTSICQGANVVLNANTGTGLTYQWKLNAANITGATTASYTASAAGSYTVVVTNASTCSQTSSATVVTVNALPTATITPVGSSVVCEGNTVVLNANTGTGLTYQWKLNSTNITGATNASYTAVASGSYTVAVTNANSCSQTSGIQSVTINPLPGAVISPAGPINVCANASATLSANTGTGLSYVWKLNGTNITGATNATYTASAAGSYTVLVTVTATGCNKLSAAVTVNTLAVPSATTLPASATAACDSVVITANSGSGLTYQWKQNSINLNGATNVSYTAMTSGSYSVIVTNSNGCSVTSTPVAVTINLSPVSVITYSSPLLFCEGGAVVLSVYSSAGLSFQWMRNSVAIPGATNVSHVAYLAGSYAVVISNTAGCSHTSSAVQVQVGPAPQPIITRVGNVLSTGSFIEYQWRHNGQPIPGANNQTFTTNQDGGYNVAVKDANGCIAISPVYFINTAGVPGSASTPDIKLYPNPAHDVLNVVASVNVQLTIKDLQGRDLIITKDLKQIDISQLAAGVYIVSVKDEEGHLLTQQKLFKAD